MIIELCTTRCKYYQSNATYKYVGQSLSIFLFKHDNLNLENTFKAVFAGILLWKDMSVLS